MENYIYLLFGGGGIYKIVSFCQMCCNVNKKNVEQMRQGK